MSTNIFESITDRIITVIESGLATGVVTWAGHGNSGKPPVNFKTGKAYRGANVLLLWATAQEKNYSTNLWLTFNQAKELGGHIKKGEKSTMGVFWGSRDVERDDGDGNVETHHSLFAKAFNVFNLDQIEGITVPDAIQDKNTWDAHAAAEALIKSSGATVIEGGTSAFYRPSIDCIHMPDRQRFACAENFYAVNFHELTHWTGAPSRCNRDLKNRFGDDAYAMEELVADLGAAFLCAETGVQGHIEGHASYIESWLNVLKKDKRAIVTAASKASQAVEWLQRNTAPSQVAA